MALDPKPRGRPRLTPDEDSVQLSVRVTAKQFDESVRTAGGARLTLAEWVRRLLDRGISANKNRP
jgi:hypothetical protein